MDVTARRRIQELERGISRYQDSYYNGEAEISDAEFDALWDELKSLDPSNAVLQRIGQDSGAFPKRTHIMPMGSQEKAANPQQFSEWARKHDYPEYLVEYKLDGASLELQYSEGTLVRAVTRGDGITGDDISANARKMQGVPERLVAGGVPVAFTGGIRGEVIMTRAVHAAHYSDKANCRNAANGLMRRKDGAGSEHLRLIVYDAVATEAEALERSARAEPSANQLVAETQPFADEEEKIRWLSLLGFHAVELRICKSAQEVTEYREQVAGLRAELEYDIDGLVVKERVIDFADAMRARPDRQIAFKFSPEEATTVLRRVVWNEAGATYTPVAEFDSVQLAGTTVQRASLVNPNTIRMLGARIGSRVVVTKRGEIIPKIESVLPQEDGDSVRDIEFPSVCSACGVALIDEGTRLFCPNKACSKRALHQILKWVSVIDIRDLGEALVTALFDAGAVRSISGIYSLTEETLTPFFLRDGAQDGRVSLGAQKVIASIASRRRVSLAAFIGGFDIEGIGETQAQKLVDAGFSTLQRLFAAREEEIAAVYGFAEISARTFVAGLLDNKEEMLRLTESGAVLIDERESGGSLAGKTFCFTGELRTMRRSAAESMVRERGGAAKNSVVKGLSYLVTNDKESGSSKNVKAAKLGIPVISEEEFLAMLD